MPIADTTSAITSIWTSWERLSREAFGSSAAISPSPSNPWRRHPMGEERRTALHGGLAPHLGAEG